MSGWGCSRVVSIGRWSVPFFVAMVAMSGGTALVAQAPTLEPGDYGQWERLTGYELDPTGRWLVSSIVRIDGERELRVDRGDGTGETLVLEHARSPLFSRDGRWLVYRKGVSIEEAEAAEDRVEDRLGLVDLTTSSDSVHFRIRDVGFRDDGRWLAALGVPAADSVGADLIVMNPATGAQTLIGNVDAFAWQDGGAVLAATLRTASGAGNGVVVFDPDAGTLRTVDSRDAVYAALTWREESPTLAVLRSVELDDREEPSHDLLLWADVRSGGPASCRRWVAPICLRTYA